MPKNNIHRLQGGREGGHERKPPHSADSIKERQRIIRNLYLTAAGYPEEDAAVAGVFVGVLPTGVLRTVAVNIEPEQCDLVADGLEAIAKKLRNFAGPKRSRRRAPVVEIR